MLSDFLLTDFKSISFLTSVLSFSFIIIFCCHTKYFLKRMYHTVIAYLSWCQYNFSIFNSTGGFHNYMITCFNLIILWTEIINLTNITKSHTNYFCHSISP